MSSVLAGSDPKQGEVLSGVQELVLSAVDDGVFPGAVLSVSRNGGPVLLKSFGSRSHIVAEGQSTSPLSIGCVFDVGELTIPFVTSSLICQLAQERRLSLEDRVSRYIQEFGVFGKSKITVAQVLSHTAGLAAEMAFHEDLSRANVGARVGILSTRSSREVVLRSINRSKLRHEPGSRFAYSQVGMILLGFLVEALRGQPLDVAAQDKIFRPLKLRSTSYVDTSRLRRNEISAIPEMIAPTEDCPWRKRLLCGEVHDPNAWALGGIAGHAGVFSSVNDLSVYCNELLLSLCGQSKFLDPEFAQRMFSIPETSDGSWALGWDSPSGDNGLLDTGLPAASRGIVSHTGCAMWLLPDQGVSIVLLSNRLHRSRSDKKFAAFLPKLIREIMAEL